SFIASAAGHRIDWRTAKFTGSDPDATALLAAARSLSGVDPVLVAVDLPVANVPFTGRREADQAISRAFGGRGCSAHSPSVSRPGPLGTRFMRDLSQEGYPLLTSKADLERLARGTIEVFPHPALLAVVGSEYRVQYKVSKSSRYWKRTAVRERI